MEVFRLTRKKFPIELSGKGASISGARWNSKGTEIVYCAQSRALAMAEVVVHLSLAVVPKDFVMLTIIIPEDIIVNELDTNLCLTADIHVNGFHLIVTASLTWPLVVIFITLLPTLF